MNFSSVPYKQKMRPRQFSEKLEIKINSQPKQKNGDLTIPGTELSCVAELPTADSNLRLRKDLNR